MFFSKVLIRFWSGLKPLNINLEALEICVSIDTVGFIGLRIDCILLLPKKKKLFRYLLQMETVISDELINLLVTHKGDLHEISYFYKSRLSLFNTDTPCLTCLTSLVTFFPPGLIFRRLAQPITHVGFILCIALCSSFTSNLVWDGWIRAADWCDSWTAQCLGVL